MALESGLWLQAAAALGAVLLLAWMVAALARRSGLAPRAGQRLRLVEALPLDQRRRLLLLRCDGREVLVITGGGQDAVLGWLPEDKA